MAMKPGFKKAMAADIKSDKRKGIKQGSAKDKRIDAKLKKKFTK